MVFFFNFLWWVMHIYWQCDHKYLWGQFQKSIIVKSIPQVIEHCFWVVELNLYSITNRRFWFQCKHFNYLFMYCCEYDMYNFTFLRWQTLPAEPLVLFARRFTRVEWNRLCAKVVNDISQIFFSLQSYVYSP
jgi:hypothetical protein